ncbi:MAG: bifunctional heptose 7-phosphate kinase/heptose 1-phosphate adenyltransferase [Saprospiraceae bacterium]
MSDRSNHLLQVIQQFTGKRVLVLGDVMLDEYLKGSVDRVSPEAPVPVVSLRSRESKPGGAANVALNLNSLGAEAVLIGLIGEDDAGRDLAQALTSEGIDANFLVTSSTRRTTRKARVMSQGQQLLRVDTEDAQPPNDNERSKLLQQVKTCLSKGKIDVILFQDYDKGVLDEQLIQAVNNLAQDARIPTVVDPKARNLWHYKGVTLFKPNLKEVSAALPALTIDSNDTQSLSAAHEALLEMLGHDQSLITLGSGGAYLAFEKEHKHIAAHPRRIADVCGAGDSVVAVAALALAVNAEAHDLLELANLAGGLTCEYVGVHPIDISDLERGIRELE